MSQATLGLFSHTQTRTFGAQVLIIILGNLTDYLLPCFWCLYHAAAPKLILKASLIIQHLPLKSFIYFLL